MCYFTYDLKYNFLDIYSIHLFFKFNLFQYFLGIKKIHTQLNRSSKTNFILFENNSIAR